MILRLAIQQARANRAYFGWASALLSLAVAGVMTGIFHLNTQDRAEQLSYRLDGAIHENNTSIWVAPQGKADNEYVQLSEAEATALVDEIAGDGAPITAFRRAYPIATAGGFRLPVATYRGSAPPAELRVGVTPGPGEVVLGRATAQRLGVGVGDTVEFAGVSVELTRDEVANTSTVTETANPGATHSYEVVGLMASTAGYHGILVYGPEAVVAWEESLGWGSIFTEEWVVDGGDPRPQTVPVQVSWDGRAASLDPYIDLDDGFWYAGVPSPIRWFAWATAGALGAAIVIMSFALGRSQAQRRLQWVATTRTLGATGSTLRTLAMVEALLLAAIAVVAGTALAALGNLAYVGFENAVVPGGILPTGLGAPAYVWAIIVLLAIVLSLIVAAVPAFWASRVPAAAALKPVNEVTEAEVSRRVSVWWLGIPFAIAAVFVPLSSGWQPELRDAALAVATLIIGIAGFMLVLEALRVALPVLGRALGGSRQPWALSAGAAIAARPRQYVAPAMVTLLFVVVAGSLAASSWVTPAFNAVGNSYEIVTAFASASVNAVTLTWSWVFSVAALAAGVAQLIALAIGVNNARTHVGDTLTQGALGLTAQARRISGFVQFVAPQVAGALLGLAIAAAIAATAPLERPQGEGVIGVDGYGASVVAPGDTALAILGIAGVFIAAIAVAGLAFALAQGRPADVRELASAHR